MRNFKINSNKSFSIIALDNPKFGENVGGAMRACQCYGASSIIIGHTDPVRRHKYMKHPMDTMHAWKSIPTYTTDDVMSMIPYDTVPIAVEILEDSVSLVNFEHPLRAFYVFGAEDSTLGSRILDKCAMKVKIPTKFCMNLAATVNVVLYDRMAKSQK